jgi:hypothetical protein
MDELAPLARATNDLAAAEDKVAQARAVRDELIVKLALETPLTYEQIAEAAGLTISGVWKVTMRAGISRQRVRVA